MNRKRIWYGLGGVLLLTALGVGYFLFGRSSRPVESLIPADALLMLDSATLQDSVSARAMRTEMPLRQVPLFAEAVQRLDRFIYAPASGQTQQDSVVVRQFLAKRPIRYSLHPVSKTALDFIFYIPVNSLIDNGFLTKLQNPDPGRLRVQSHTFGGERVYELSTPTNEVLGTFLVLNNYLVGSPSGILIENVIRRHRDPLARINPVTFKSDDEHIAGLSIRPEVMQVLFGQTDERQSAETGSLIRLFMPENLTFLFRQSAARTHLIGYASDIIGSRRDVANLFDGQTPQRISSAAVIPQTTATLYHIGVTNGPRFGQTIQQLLQSNPTLTSRLSRIRAVVPDLYASLGTDVLLCRLESIDSEIRQVLLLKATDLKQLSDSYQRAGYLAGAATPAPLKTFLGHKTLLLDTPELPASLFSSLFAGFRQSWVTQHGAYLVVANSEEVMQDYLQQLSRGAVWSADERQTALLETTLRPANFTAFVRVNRAAFANTMTTWPVSWRNLLTQRVTGFGNLLPAQASSLNNLENMVYQASYGNKRILSTLVLGRTTRRATTAILNRLLLQRKVEFNAPLTSGPVVAGNLADGSALLWAINGAGQFVLIPPTGETIVERAIDGPIRSNVVGADYLNNGRLQYLFMTERSLYIADLTDRSATVQSKPLPTGLDPSLLALPHGTHQRNRLVLAAHKDGFLYAFDKEKRSFIQMGAPGQKGPLLLPFQVIVRPTGMDILALQANGTLNRWLDTGAQAPHFPVTVPLTDTTSRFAGPALQPGGAGTIDLVSNDGERLKLNENGLIASRTQLYRTVRNGAYRLFPDVDQTDFLLLRTTDTEVAVLNEEGQEQFAIRGIRSGQNDLRYHRLGAGIDVLSVRSGRFTTLYDRSTGRILGDRPIPSDFPVALQYDETTNQLFIVSGYDKTVQVFTIRLR